MIPGIERFYQRIADSMVPEIPEEWTTARYDVVFYPGNSIYEAEYVRAADGKARSLSPTNDGPRCFRELRKAFKEAGQSLWGRAQFLIDRNGQFKMNWDYDRCDERGNAIYIHEERLKAFEERCRRLNSD